MIIRAANHTDMESLMRLFEGAKAIMRASGNFHQWSDGYPSEDVVAKDIERAHCFVACENDLILGTMALIPGPDPTYSQIEGRWSDDSPYYVIHRIATPAPGRNIAIKLFDWAYGYIVGRGCILPASFIVHI